MSSRTGHLLRKYWINLGIQYADRDVPLSFPLATSSVWVPAPS